MSELVETNLPVLTSPNVFELNQITEPTGRTETSPPEDATLQRPRSARCIIESHVPVRKIAIGAAIGVAALAGALAPRGGEALAAHKPRPSHSSPHRHRPAHHKAHKRCKPAKQIALKLVDMHKTDTQGNERFKVVAASCRRTHPKKLSHVTLEELGPDSRHHYKWKVKHFPPHTKKTKYFSIAPPEFQSDNVSPVPPENTVQTIILKALTRHGKLLGRSRWTLKYDPETHSYQPPSRISPITADKNLPCTPDPEGLTVGDQDDNQFVYQQDINRTEAFQQGETLFGAKALRIFMIPEAVDKYGLQNYIDTIQEAYDRGYKVILTMVPNPSYIDSKPDELSYQNLDPNLMQQFIDKVLTPVKDKVWAVELFNEVNLGGFSINSHNPEKFAAFYVPAYYEVKGINSNIRVLAGGLAPTSWDNLQQWFTALNALPKDGISFHPYGPYMSASALAELRLMGNAPVYPTEFGNFTSDPNQLADDQRAIDIARCAGAKLLIFYQLVRDPTKPWDTGVIDSPLAKQVARDRSFSTTLRVSPVKSASTGGSNATLISKVVQLQRP